MIRAFVSALQYRRRPRPVKTSTRDAAGIISTSSPDIISTLSLAKRSGRQNPRSGQPTKGGGKAPLTVQRAAVADQFGLVVAPPTSLLDDGLELSLHCDVTLQIVVFL